MKFQLVSVIIRAIRGMYPLGDKWGQDGTASRNDPWVSSESEFASENHPRLHRSKNDAEGHATVPSPSPMQWPQPVHRECLEGYGNCR